MIDFKPKQGRYGDVRWTGFLSHPYTHDGLTTYVMVRAGTSGICRDDSKGIIEVRKREAGLGWELVVEDERASQHGTKSEAQRAAEDLVGVSR